jgi:hypothetical protein
MQLINAAAKADERLAFASRLKHALQASNINPSITKVARTFNLHTKGEKVTVHAVRKWLIGESIPTQEKVQELSEIVGCAPAWLRFGTEDAAAPRPAIEFTVDERNLIRSMRHLQDHEQRAVHQLVASLLKGSK